MELWNRLCLKLGNDVWLVGGVFNLITSVSENKCGNTPNLILLADFSDAQLKIDLFVLGFNGFAFTLSRGHVFERYLNMWIIHPSFKQFVSDKWKIAVVGNVGYKLWQLPKSNMELTLTSKYEEIKLALESSDSGTEALHNCTDGIEGTEVNTHHMHVHEGNILADDTNVHLVSMAFEEPVETKILVDHNNTNNGNLFAPRTSIQFPIARAATDTVDINSTLSNADAQNIIDSLESQLDASPALVDIVAQAHIALMDAIAIEENLLKQKSNDSYFVEILNTFKSICPNKAPGPDGFSSTFYINSWKVIKNEVILAIQSFFLGDNPGKNFTSALIVLILKGNDKISWDNFRSLSLTTVISKVMSKIIVNRLQPYLSYTIAAQRSTFIKVRDISDNILLAQEIIEDLDKKCRGGNMVLKLDIKKSFDTISLDFIINLLQAKGFQQDFCSLIKRWLSNNCYSVMVNGKAHGFFSANGGIKQGDPLSTKIFIIAFDYFSRLINKLQYEHSYIQYSHKSKIMASHLAYANDAILFLNASKRAIKATMYLLKEFQNTSGMMFNLTKCTIYFIKGVPSNTDS
ncbi:uncharacterized protein LOC110033172 [Phalaenopsis equestris]|uniref:uncharacterized protein LOC110033172 n=1 Tax=Phalaenopsis equestris TaxID=78828 RepID=UPI0009E5C32A|nr:uncharacterized protein LOC110033172 [Phalaenopsis equestris]